MLEEFIAMSQVLTGLGNLKAELARAYLDRLTSSPFGPQLKEILSRFRELKPEGGAGLEEQVQAKILADDALRPAVSQIVLLWFTSAMWERNGPALNLRYGGQEEYFSGLAWSLIGAHPPGLSGGYFGHWRYRPENEPVEKP
jgi:D-sorbitol dehydrogenase-like protein